MGSARTRGGANETVRACKNVQERLPPFVVVSTGARRGPRLHGWILAQALDHSMQVLGLVETSSACGLWSHPTSVSVVLKETANREGSKGEIGSIIRTYASKFATPLVVLWR